HRLVGLDRGGARAVSNCVRAVQAVAVLAIGVGARVGLDRGRGGRRVGSHEMWSTPSTHAWQPSPSLSAGGADARAPAGDFSGPAGVAWCSGAAARKARIRS